MRSRARYALLLRLAVAVVAVVGVGVAFWQAVLTPEGQRIEQQLLLATEFRATSRLLGLVSVPHLLLACIGAALVAALRRRWDVGVAAVGALAVANVAGQVLKDVLERPGLVDLAENSFPSGHMIAFGSVVVAALMAAPPAARPLLAVVGAIPLSAASVTLLTAGWHRPSDLVGSGLVVVAACAAASLVAADPPPSRPGAHRLAETALWGIGTLAVLVGAGIAIVARASGRLDPGDALLAAGCVAAVGLVLVQLAVVLLLLRAGGVDAARRRAHAVVARMVD